MDADSQVPANDQSSGKESVHLEASKQNNKIPKSPIKPKTKIEDFDADGVFLAEDHYAEYYDELGNQHDIKRFTWKNKNKIQIEVINFGARVISIRLPDRTGEVEDVLLGFDELAGYLHYDKLYCGSIVGRVSNIIKNSCFSIGDKKFNITANFGNHSIHGGSKGLDKTVWDTYITDKKVIMSHISPHLSEGYPGHLLVRAVFELSAKNEFKIYFEAETTQPSCIDLSQLLFFNLAGHHRGPDEIYRHILTLNCNCFTPQIDRIPTGEILNVIHTQFDFQIPKVLGKVIGIVPKDGFDQNLCVNRGMYQDQCFVGRLLHPPTGRMLEIYSNQPGVRLYTANHFSNGNLISMEDILGDQDKVKALVEAVDKPDNTMRLFQKIHKKVVDLLKIDELQNFDEIKGLIHKFALLKYKNIKRELTNDDRIRLTRLQLDYLEKSKEIVCENEETDDPCLDLKDILSEIIKVVDVIEPEVYLSDSKGSTSNTSNSPKIPKQSSSSSGEKIEKPIEKSLKPSSSSLTKSEHLKHSKSSSLNNPLLKEHHQNIIPVYYTNSNHIVGKGRAVYKSHGAIAMQTQNYPNAVNIKHFPNTILNPGEVYRHEITYRFWIRAGNPNKWIKRNLAETKQKSGNNGKLPKM